VLLTDCLILLIVLYNGVPANTNAKLQSHIAFVEQNDLFYKNLTVEEHLRYQASLRLNCDAKDCEKRVCHILDAPFA
jgi:ABC-type multidrug transport system ATPase subunit